MRGEVDKCLETTLIRYPVDTFVGEKCLPIFLEYNIRLVKTKTIYQRCKSFVEKYEQDLRNARNKSPFSEGMTDIIQLRNEINNYQYRMKDGFDFYADTIAHRKNLLKEMLKRYYNRNVDEVQNLVNVE